MSYLAVADHGFWDTFKEATAAAKFMAHAKADTQSPLDPRPRRRHQDGPRQAGHAHMADMSGEVAKRVSEAKATSQAKSPTDVRPSRRSSSDRQATADAAQGVDDARGGGYGEAAAALA